MPNLQGCPKNVRVWDGKQMHYPPHDYVLTSSGTLLLSLPKLQEFGKDHDGDPVTLAVADDDHRVMRATGLTGSDGTPIYHSDVVQTRLGIGVVRWSASGAGFCIQGVPGHMEYHTPTVLSNRYEDPDLVSND